MLQVLIKPNVFVQIMYQKPDSNSAVAFIKYDRDIKEGGVFKVARVVPGAFPQLIQSVLQGVLVQEKLLGGLPDRAVAGKKGGEQADPLIDFLIGTAAKNLVDKLLPGFFRDVVDKQLHTDIIIEGDFSVAGRMPRTPQRLFRTAVAVAYLLGAGAQAVRPHLQMHAAGGENFPADQ